MVCILLSALGNWSIDIAELLLATLSLVSESCSPCRGPAWRKIRPIREELSAPWLMGGTRKWYDFETRTTLELKEQGRFCLDVNEAYFIFGRFAAKEVGLETLSF